MVVARPAPVLQVWHADVNRRWPIRLRGGRFIDSDGWIGDLEHQKQGSLSGHNPDTRGIVHARDFDIDGIGQPMMLVAALCRHPSTRYVIFNRLIWHVRNGFRPARYTGSDPHTSHIHAEIERTVAAENCTTHLALPEQSRPQPKPVEEDDDMQLITRDLPVVFSYDPDGERLDCPLHVTYVALPGLASPRNVVPWGTGYLSLSCDGYGAAGPAALRYRVAVGGNIASDGSYTTVVRSVQLPVGKGAVPWQPAGTELPQGTTWVEIGRQQLVPDDELIGDVTAGLCLEIDRRR